VKKFVAALAASVAVLGMGAATASADNITWGVNDDAGKYENGVGPFWTTLLGVGMTSDTITLRWDETSATGFDGSEANFVGRSLAAAKAAGVEVTLDVYPRHSAALSNPANAAKFATWVSSLAKSYPYVKEFVVMNECNTSLFANPQYARGKNVSAPACGAFLAAAYDSLKAVDSSIFIWGLRPLAAWQPGAEERTRHPRNRSHRLAGVPRQLVPPERSHGAADGRSRRPSVSDPSEPALRGRLPRPDGV